MEIQDDRCDFWTQRLRTDLKRDIDLTGKFCRDEEGEDVRSIK